jgi:predicted transcriptional regulator
MPSTIRISSAAHRSLAEMAEQTDTSLQEMLDRAIEHERRRLLLERTNLAYSKLRQNKKAWHAWRAELRQLDATLSDGI